MTDNEPVVAPPVVTVSVNLGLFPHFNINREEANQLTVNKLKTKIAEQTSIPIHQTTIEYHPNRGAPEKAKPTHSKHQQARPKHTSQHQHPNPKQWAWQNMYPSYTNA